MIAMHPKREPNQHVLIFLHPIPLCRVTYLRTIWCSHVREQYNSTELYCSRTWELGRPCYCSRDWKLGADTYIVLGNGNSDGNLVLGLGNEGLRRRARDEWIRVWWYVRGSHCHRQWGLVEKWSERWKKRKRQLTTRSWCAREAMPRVSSRGWDSVEPKVRKSVVVVVVLFPRGTRMHHHHSATLWSKPALEERRKFRLR